MEILRYLDILWKRKFVFLAVFVATVAVAFIGNQLVTPTYESVALVRVSTPPVGDNVWLDYNLGYGDRLKNTYVQLATSDHILVALKQNLAIETVPKITVEDVFETELIRITVEHEDPKFAQKTANELVELIQSRQWETADSVVSNEAILEARLGEVENDLSTLQIRYEAIPPESGTSVALQGEIESLETTYDRLTDQYEQARVFNLIQANAISVVQPATLPSDPSSPNTRMNLFLGVIAGLVGGLGLTFGLEAFDTKLYTEQDIQAVKELPIIGKVPYIRRPSQRFPVNKNLVAGEALRRIRNALFANRLETLISSLLVTSPTSHGGTSMVTANLAYLIAQSNQKVLVIDADMRASTQKSLWKVNTERGLSDVLKGDCDFEEVIVDTKIPGIFLLASGRADQKALELLSTEMMAGLLRKARFQFDFVLIDSPALQSAAEASGMSHFVDATMLVIHSGQVRAGALQSVLQQLAFLNVNLLGVVMNGVSNDEIYNSAVKK